MSGIMPEGEGTRRAIRWISSELQEKPGSSLWKLVEEAITLFDLNPMEAEKLMQFYRENKSGGV